MLSATMSQAPWATRPGQKVFKSRFAPSYKPGPHFLGITPSAVMRWAPTAGYFGAATGIFLFFFFAEIPRVSKDIGEKLPIIGPWFHKEIAPEDNPF
ncbi:uncharacterized protein PV09_09321 [Verruconis gallopava]|uniref:Uncharacterized protein n=1 Tax=Verruconis gallopava TaxID=253628 RepID=A0A0D1X9T9_9PEZI|nr:uncharacterized protein PV09_09321 [Verruconis gallopava]KIV98935.1 hypothetical protein PV09_09321 [Verruconis gallopava]